MNIPEICITFISALVGVAYPILLEVVSRLDEKYSSLIVVNLFKTEKEWKLFRFFLTSSLICVLTYLIINLPFLPFCISSVFQYWFISVFIASTLALIVTFLFFVKKIITYYSTNQVLQYFDRQAEDEEYTYFQATSDILLLSITKQDTVTARTASDIIYNNFRSIRVANADRPVQYPDIFYQKVYRTIQELIFSKDERFTYLEHRSLGGIWFLGELDKAKIHEDTFSWLWKSLVLAVRHERDDMVMQYWSVAHQHFIYELQDIQPEHTRIGDKLQIINGQSANDRRLERERFLEFNHALGGLLLNRGRLDVIRRMFRYTTSWPPTYDLLPLWMNEVFTVFFKFRDPYDYNFRFINSRYYFPDSEGIHGEGLVKHWICKYAALLFLRQYSIVPHLYYMKPLAFPDIPVKQSEKRLWLENLGYFKDLVLGLLQDQQLLKEVGLDFLINQWFIDQKKPHPSEFIENLKAHVDQAFEDTEQNQLISDDKRQSFYTRTKSILTNALNVYKEVLAKDLEGSTRSWFVPSITMVANKAAFSDNQDADHINFDSVLASEQAERIRKSVFETFHNMRSENFLIKKSELFLAIDKLSLDPTQYVIVNFDVDLKYFIHIDKIPGLSENKYKSIPILSLEGKHPPLINSSLFILKKTDLPALKFEAPKVDIVSKYFLEEIDDTLNIYASVIDLNIHEALRRELETEETHAKLNKSVLMYIATNIEIKWKKSVKMLALSQYTEFRDRGVPNNLIDIKFDKE